MQHIGRDHQPDRIVRPGVALDREPQQRDQAGADDPERSPSIAETSGHGENEETDDGDQRRDPERAAQRLTDERRVTQRVEPTADAGGP